MNAHISRPTGCNSVALGRFIPGGPIGYRAMLNDGSYGPVRTTRAEAEADYTNDPNVYTPTLRDLLSNVRALSSFIRQWEAAIKAHDTYRASGFDAGYGEQFETHADELSRTCDHAHNMVTSMTRLYVGWWGEDHARRIYDIANRYA